MLGLADRARIVDLFEHVMKGDVAAALAEFRAQYDTGADPAAVLTDLAEFNHLVTRLRFVPTAADDASLTEDERQRGADFARTLSVRVLSRTWQMLLKGIPEVQSSNRPVSAAEMVLIRLAHAADLPTLDEALKSLDGGAAGAEWRRRARTARRQAAGNGGGASAVAQTRMPARVGRRARPCGWSRPRPRRPPSSPPPRARAGAAAGAGEVAGRHRRPCRRQSRHGLQGAAQALRPPGPHRARPPRGQPDRRCAEDAAQRPDDEAAAPGPAATGWCRCRREEGGQTLAEMESTKRENAFLDAKSDPTVAAILARFPGAKIIDVRIPDAPEADSRRGRPAGRAAGGRRRNLTESMTKDRTMKDLLGLMGKAKEMQAKFQAMQDEIATLEATGQSGGGLVSVTLTGKFEMKSLKIDPSLFKEDEVEILEDLILAAHNDAKAKVEAIMQEKTKALTAGLPIPPGMKLPF